ncbi:VOC family protein [Ramlibacter alkalitolerans]|uniref:VOC family protein n=1 Tax=Ramlibacter alkalitolerans TaxID=2039631 RepID=A0ABS1JVP1_9BURK|nr:VOC family protein [Ramlibacter alkalitolerans]MBL0428378.1 VOC family protein [Ramlibacter alkalitolerans]
MRSHIDHLVVGADSLEQGVAWCEATLGVTPGPGGEHPLMGTHNRLLRIATVDFPRTYFEIIAVQPGRTPQRARRWFDLDDEALRDRLRREGPRLLHFVASVPDVQRAVQAWHALGLDRGEVVAASRDTPRGLLQWQITVRPDGQRLFDGVLPTLIQWGETHPAPGLPESGVTLHALVASHPQAPRLRAAYEAIGLAAVRLDEGPPQLRAVFDTPRGRVTLAS